MEYHTILIKRKNIIIGFIGLEIRVFRVIR